MGKTGVENLDSKSILSNLSGITANATKETKSLKTEINDAKSDHVINKNNINSVNDFIEKRKGSLKVRDSFISISNDILTKKKMNIKLILKIIITLLTMIRQ